MGAAASVEANKKVTEAKSSDLKEFVNGLGEEERLTLASALKQPRYTLYVRSTGAHSMRVMIFVMEAGIMDDFEIIDQTKIPKETIDEIKSQCSKDIDGIKESGKTWLPCLKKADGYMVDDDQILTYLTEKHTIERHRLRCFPMFDFGMYKDYLFMQDEMLRLAGDNTKKESDVQAWYSALDKDGDGTVDLDEIITGLDATRLLAEASRGADVNTHSNRWRDTLAQVDQLTKGHPEFREGWRTSLLLGTICDDYDRIINSADQVCATAPDSQALTLKGLYCNALKRTEGFESAIKGLNESFPKAAAIVDKLVKRVDKYWAKELSHDVPKGIEGKVAIVALGSPADDDGTPRPRLMGTLNKTLQAAKEYPDVDIFVTGAAVSSNMPEAIAMKKWLGDRDIDTKRITMEMKAMDTVGNYEFIAPMLKERGVTKVILITVYYHLNRSSALADAVFENKGVEVEVIGVAGESDLKGEVLAKRMTVERPASYRDVARASGMYEFEDHEKVNKSE